MALKRKGIPMMHWSKARASLKDMFLAIETNRINIRYFRKVEINILDHESVVLYILNNILLNLTVANLDFFQSK